MITIIFNLGLDFAVTHIKLYDKKRDVQLHTGIGF